MVRLLHAPITSYSIRMGPSTGTTDRRSACSLIAAGRSCFKTMSSFASVNGSSFSHLTQRPLSNLHATPSAMQCFDGSSMSFADTLTRIGAHSLSTPVSRPVLCAAHHAPPQSPAGRSPSSRQARSGATHQQQQQGEHR
ncbi:surface protease GP63 [Trypanosoma rangeli]|uniref:Surface protease GP63 n=1 Tax=Trypanosoma rangeli TaxID=5698 RepID=A0A422MWP9_TRYRA|nr:surface protease GP63 [Trypanosoma rangeli]RNE97674.1 surface protease GP63 [Trypanosoma rangeli]|eukprot:RNE97674.1 surface protease GP63 [Trypanosoma rangeli]